MNESRPVSSRRSRFARVATYLCALAPVLVTLVASASCGSRTGLLPEEPFGEGTDAGSTPDHVVPRDVSVPPGDTGALDDVTAPEDTGVDAPEDAGEDVIEDVLQPIDATPPPDTGLECPDSSIDAYAYLVSTARILYSFDPSTNAAVPLTTLTCATSSIPYTMTVTEGAAYVMYQDGTLFRVDLSTYACTPTPFNAGTIGFQTAAGLPLASSYAGGQEWLYTLGCIQNATTCVPTLARADLTTYTLGLVGTVAPFPTGTSLADDMKSDPFGRLFAISFTGTLLEIDNTNADVLAVDQTGFSVSNAEALLTWNGSIYIFGGQTGIIDTYDLATQTLTTVGTVGDAIAGAGSAPCVH